MNEVLSFYQKQAQALRSSHPILAKIQAEGLSAFIKQGFPTRRDEDWKYSSPDLFLQARFHPPVSSLSFSHQVPSHDAPFWGQKLLIENGQVLGKEHLTLPSGVVIGSFEETLENHPGILDPYLSRLSRHEHGFQALNTAMLQTSLVIYVPKNQYIATPLTLAHWQNQSNQAVYSRCVVILEPGAQLTLLEEYTGEKDCSYFTNSLTEIFLAADAQLTHVQIQQESRAAMHLSHVFTYQASLSRFKNHVIHLGGKWVRGDKSVYLQGKNANCLLNGIYGLTHKQHVDQHTTISHDVSDCESTQDYKGVLTGPSRAVFNGRVVVKKDAQHSKALQQNKNLLLSKDAEVDTKPQLEIYANDVQCSHGATVGQMSEEALFYFLSRGIDREEAIRFLVDAFTATNLAWIEDEALRQWITELLHSHLQGV